MKAIRFHAHGKSDVLRLEDIPEPTAQHNTVVIGLKACALNHLDLWVRRGLPGVKIPLPHIPGSDMAGVVVEVGSGVTSLQKGDEVIVSPGTSCGTCMSCLQGSDHLCRHYRLLGEHIDGGYCQFIALPASNVVRKPSHLSFPEAASFPLVFLTAWHMLVTLGQIQPGQSVLIHAAGSGIGSAAIQIASLFGATIFATASSEAKLQKAQTLGAHHLINYKKEDFASRIRDVTGKRGVDLVFEHTGEKTFEPSYMSLCRGGTLVTCGATSGYQAKIDLRYLFSRQLKILGSTMGSKSELLRIVQLFEEKKFKAIVDRTFALEDAAKAQDYLEEGNQFGKVVITI